MDATAKMLGRAIISALLVTVLLIGGALWAAACDSGPDPEPQPADDVYTYVEQSVDCTYVLNTYTAVYTTPYVLDTDGLTWVLALEPSNITSTTTSVLVDRAAAEAVNPALVGACVPVLPPAEPAPPTAPPTTTVTTDGYTVPLGELG